MNKFVFETDDENTITYTVTYPKDGTEGSVKVEATGFVDKDFIEQTTWQGYSITDLNAKYIISFDANGGTGEMADQEATITNSQVVSANLTKIRLKERAINLQAGIRKQMAVAMLMQIRLEFRKSL